VSLGYGPAASAQRAAPAIASGGPRNLFPETGRAGSRTLLQKQLEKSR
jgi:hypothetical protein